MTKALEERQVTAMCTNAMLEENPQDEPTEHLRGWTAEVRDNEEGETVFNTFGYADKHALIKDLQDAGIVQIDYYE